MPAQTLVEVSSYPHDTESLYNILNGEMQFIIIVHYPSPPHGESTAAERRVKDLTADLAKSREDVIHAEDARTKALGKALV